MSSPIDQLLFRRACAKFVTGVAIASVYGPDGSPHGMTVNSFTSVSLEPPMVLICVDHATPLLSLFRSAGRYGLSVLAQGSEDISNRFAQRGQDRFGAVPWFHGHNGVPLLSGALAHFECTIEREVPAGDHAVLIAYVEGLSAGSGLPLAYFESSYRRIAE